MMRRIKFLQADGHLCKTCGKQLIRKLYPSGVYECSANYFKRKYCDKQCFGKSHKPREIPKTKGAARNAAQRKRKSKCEKCGGKNWLSIHHIDKNVFNNTNDNLLTLCKSCHQKWHWDNDPEYLKKKKIATCEICGEKASSIGLCKKHYHRYVRYGDPLLYKGRGHYTLKYEKVEETKID